MATNPSPEALPVNIEFIWDKGNLRHIIHDHPERGNSVDEVESIFGDPHFIGDFDRLDPKSNEPRYWGMGIGTQGIVKYVVYVLRNGKIRPITCYVVNRKQRSFYHEQVNPASGKETQSGRD